MKMGVVFKVTRNDLAKQLKQEIEGYNFEVGIVEDKPLLQGDYGSNTASTQNRKGFDKPMIMTGQFFNLIKAVVRRKKA